MKAITDFIKQKFSLFLSIFTATVIAYILYIMGKRQDQIDLLETEKADAEAQNAIQKKEDELHEIKTKADEANTRMVAHVIDLNDAVTKLNELRKQRGEEPLK